MQHIDGRYLARPAAGDGEAAAGDHLQLGWAFWLPGHQLEHGGAPWADPYTFRPEATRVPEPAGVAARDPLLAAAGAAREHLGVQPRRPPLDRRRRRAHVLVAPGTRARSRRRPRRRPRLRPGAVPARPVDRPSARPDRVPAAGRAARARAAPVRLGCDRAHRDPAQRPDPPGDGSSRPRTRVHVGAGTSRRLVEGGRRRRRRLGGGGHRAAGRRRRLDREWRPLLRPGAALLGRALRPRHARSRSGHRGVRVPRLADPDPRSRRPLGDPASARARGLPRARRRRAVRAGARREPAAVRAALEGAAATPLRARARAPDADRLPRDRRARRARRCLCVESTQGRAGAGRSWRRAWLWRFSRSSRSTCGCPCSAPSPPTRPNAAYAAIRRRRPPARAAGVPARHPLRLGGDGLREAVAARAARSATRRRRRRPPTGWLGSSGRSPAVAARSPPTSESASSSCTAASTSRVASSPPVAPLGAEAALRRAGWRLLARDGAISSWERP